MSRRAVAVAADYMKMVLIGLVHWYQKYVSPALPASCKYYPSCSQYAVDALTSYGVLRGLVLAAWRLLRCNPLSNGGYDPVERQRLFRSRESKVTGAKAEVLQSEVTGLVSRRATGKGKTAIVVMVMATLLVFAVVLSSCSFLTVETTSTTSTTIGSSTSTTVAAGGGGWYQGIFTPVANLFFAVLHFLHSNLGIGWGWSIVLLTVIVRIILIPLTWKQIKSMRAMQAVQPQLKALQEKYKNDRQMLNQKTMEFYSENKINPFGSCLPLVFQIPVFIGLFYMLKNAGLPVGVGIGNAAGAFVSEDGLQSTVGWLWVSDITKFSYALMFLYIGSQFMASWQMARNSVASQQKYIAFAMPIFVGIFMFMYKWPAGLFIYWVTSNLWTVAQQYLAEKVMPIHAPVPAKGGGSTAKRGGKGGMMATLAKAAEDKTKKATDASKGSAKSGDTTSDSPKGKASTGGSAKSKGSAKGAAGKTGAPKTGAPKKGATKTGTSKSGSAGGASKKSSAGRPGGQTGGKTSGQQSGKQQGKTAGSKSQRSERGDGGPKSSS
jgi:YidC/Oxa1 family membrane protein insertase